MLLTRDYKNMVHRIGQRPVEVVNASHTTLPLLLFSPGLCLKIDDVIKGTASSYPSDQALIGASNCAANITSNFSAKNSVNNAANNSGRDATSDALVDRTHQVGTCQSQ